MKREPNILERIQARRLQQRGWVVEFNTQCSFCSMPGKLACASCQRPLCKKHIRLIWAGKVDLAYCPSHIDEADRNLIAMRKAKRILEAEQTNSVECKIEVGVIA